MPRRTRIQLLGKIDQIDRERLADGVAALIQQLRRQWPAQRERHAPTGVATGFEPGRGQWR